MRDDRLRVLAPGLAPAPPLLRTRRAELWRRLIEALGIRDPSLGRVDQNVGVEENLSANGQTEATDPLKKNQVRSLAYQLLDAVSYCHNRGIVHRNLKPKHLLIIPGNGEDPLDNAQLKLGNILVV